MTTIEKVTLHGAVIGGQLTAWDVLCRAAVQDYDSGVPCVPPNGDTALADQYREILRSALPLIATAVEAAYADYCRVGATNRGSNPAHAIGHGSWVQGPDPARQDRWNAWKRLQERVAKAARQPAAR